MDGPAAGLPDWGERWQSEVARLAEERLPAPVWRHFAQGAHEGLSAAEATSSWSRLRFAPHVMRDVSKVHTATRLLGQLVSTPIGIAPTSMQHHADPSGEVAMARAAAESDSLVVVPSNAGSSFADIGATGAHWWLQTYLTHDREVVVPVLRRAVDAGATAVVLTADTPQVSTRFGADDEAWADVPDQPRRVNFDPDGATPDLAGAAHARDVIPRDIAWLREQTGLPVVVKGVLRPDDARRCVHHGAAAIWVSNHGGRQLDRAVAPAEVLPAVISSVGASAEVYVDGGVRNGLDTLAALALGARAVFLGRLPLFALAAGGQGGVTHALQRLDAELREAMGLAGCPDLAAVAGLVAATP
jgi:4-hydroxymandelate oxidase